MHVEVRRQPVCQFSPLLHGTSRGAQVGRFLHRHTNQLSHRWLHPTSKPRECGTHTQWSWLLNPLPYASLCSFLRNLNGSYHLPKRRLFSSLCLLYSITESRVRWTAEVLALLRGACAVSIHLQTEGACPKRSSYFRMIRSLDFFFIKYVCACAVTKNHQKTSEHPVLEL